MKTSSVCVFAAIALLLVALRSRTTATAIASEDHS
jgi:hypothetical protein